MNEDQEEFRFEAMKGCVTAGITWVALIAIALVVIALTSCSSPKVITDTNNEQYHSQLVSRMDSILHATSVWQQSMYQKQTSLVDSFKNVEVRDTSRVIFLSEKGDTVKETIIIKEVIEREHTLSESTQEYWQEMYQRTDSLLRIAEANQERMDSILQSYKKTAVVEKAVSTGEKVKWALIGIGWSVGLLLVVFSAYMKKS